MKNGVSLLVFLILVIGGGLAAGLVAMPGDWYAGLHKPPFNPPNWIFGPVWTLLYIFIAIAGWRVWVHARDSLAMKLWWAQLVLNLIWSPTFFALHQVAVALAIVLGMLALILGFIATAWSRDRTAALLFVPYAAWVSFASLLNGAILVLN